MFKFGSIENELINEMQNKLVKNQLKKVSYNQSKLSNAAELLNNAANICDQLGLIKQADEITEILQSLITKDGNND